MMPVLEEDDANDVEDFRLNFSDEVEGKLWKAARVAEKSERRKDANKQNHRWNKIANPTTDDDDNKKSLP